MVSFVKTEKLNFQDPKDPHDHLHPVLRQFNTALFSLVIFFWISPLLLIGLWRILLQYRIGSFPFTITIAPFANIRQKTFKGISIFETKFIHSHSIRYRFLIIPIVRYLVSHMKIYEIIRIFFGPSYVPIKQMCILCYGVLWLFVTVYD